MSPGRTEIEFKWRLAGREESEALRAAARRLGFVESAPALQTNHFFDTAAGDLRRADSIVRMREEGGRFVLCAKGPGHTTGSVLHRRTEEEVEITTAEAREVLERRGSPLQLLLERLDHPLPELLSDMNRRVGSTSLSHVGAFTNERRRLRHPGHELTLELDRTEFPDDSVHHELELECTDETEPAARALLNELRTASGVDPREATSKAARFFRSIEGSGPAR